MDAGGGSEEGKQDPTMGRLPNALWTLFELYHHGDKSRIHACRLHRAFALLFYRSSWTQEELTKKEDKAQPYIARRLLFGRFLNFMPTGINPEFMPPGRAGEEGKRLDARGVGQKRK